jgi:sugar phosphate isomerase/epimerase
MKLSLCGAGLGASLDFLGFAELASEHDFAAVDFGLGGAKSAMEALGGLEAFAQKLGELGVELGPFGLDIDWRKDDAAFEAGLPALAEGAALAGKLGATRCCTWMLPATDHDPEVWTRAVSGRFQKVADIFAPHGIRLGLEWVGPHHLRAGGVNATGKNRWVETLPDTLKLIERIGRENVGLLVDSYHLYTTSATEAELAALTDAQIVHVHINDAQKGVGPAGARDGERVLPGAGEIDLTAFLRGLRATGYTGFISCEVLTPTPLGATPAEAATNIRESLRALGL